MASWPATGNVTTRPLPVLENIQTIIDEETKEPFLYLLILLVLKKYRRLGLASKMLKFVYEQLEKLQSKIKFLDLHVQKINTAAVGFYKNEGFEVVEEITNYYTDIENGDALHMRKYLNK